jgi:hypothetical protein
MAIFRPFAALTMIGTKGRIPSVHGLNLRATADLWLSLIELLKKGVHFGS